MPYRFHFLYTIKGMSRQRFNVEGLCKMKQNLCFNRKLLKSLPCDSEVENLLGRMV